MAKWAKFDITGTPQERAQLAEMLAATGRFCLDVQAGLPQPRWLSLLGSSGAGKSYLAKRIWRWHRVSDRFRSRMVKTPGERDEVVYPGQFCFWPDLAGELHGNRGYDQLDDLKRDWLVIIDEVGADRDPNGHVKDCLARVLSARVEKWTVITSNKTLEEIANSIDPRIASRMIRDGSEVVQIDVRDFWLRE